MPTYVYEPDDPARACDVCRAGFERVQKMRDDPLPACEACSAPVHRVIQRTFVATPVTKPNMSDGRLEKLGFTKIVKDDDGQYKKVFGNDPAARALPSVDP